MANNYWTASTYILSPINAWYVGFDVVWWGDHAEVADKNARLYVRAVRP